MIAVFMGLVCSSHFAIILIPVSRDSKIWSALGVPFERAVLYHVIAGHLTFISLFLHAFLFVVHWVTYKGWGHAVHESIHVDPNTHGGDVFIISRWCHYTAYFILILSVAMSSIVYVSLMRACVHECVGVLASFSSRASNLF